MKSVFLTFIGIVLCTIVYSQKIDLQDTIIQNGGIAGIKIGDHIIQIIKSNPDFTFQEESVFEYGVDGEEMGWLVVFENEPLFFVWNKGDSMKIGGFCILSNKFVLSNGLRIGSTIADFIETYDDFYLTFCDLNGINEYFALPDIVINNRDFVTTLFEFDKPVNDYVGVYQNYDFDESTSTFTGTFYSMTTIHIYKWN